MTLQKIAFGKLVDDKFKEKVISICGLLNIPPDWLMTCMAFETGERFKASTVNKVSSATGLIQFMRPTAIELGTTIEKLALMNEVDQLDYVYKYFIKYKLKLKTLGDLYMAILWPAAAGKPKDYVLFKKDDIKSKAYLQNAGLDTNKDRIITKEEVCMKIERLYMKGMSESFYG